MRKRRRPGSRKERKERNSGAEGRPGVKVLVGLGNPGEDYEATRHNIGFQVARAILQRWGRPYEEKKARSIVGRARIGDQPVIVARPLITRYGWRPAPPCSLAWNDSVTRGSRRRFRILC